MPIYSLLIEGRDFPARVIEGAKGPMGFYATRVVEATKPSEAEEAAVGLIRSEYSDLLGERQLEDNDPTLHVEEIKELESLPVDFANTGAAWFPMEE